MGGKRAAQKQTVYKPTPVQLTYGVVEANKFNMKSPPNGLSWTTVIKVCKGLIIGRNVKR
ncbi:hypothetical protein DPMN_185193 [Dreissena polymorpha]|uniref:Uncharacterized protein n=1 Tax=Dreissena polymorpha TaxID=45954 RepID=A0A9D4DN59_DREPO|nr:hypothetical protein DPMN_185193 [Dreissena polymorpha]